MDLELSIGSIYTTNLLHDSEMCVEKVMLDSERDGKVARRELPSASGVEDLRV